MRQPCKLLPTFLVICLCVAGLSTVENHWIQNPTPFIRSMPPTAIPAITRNLSGITWNSERHSFFVITNSPQVILELDRNGTPVRAIRLDGFADTEDIVHLEGNQFAIVEERLGQIRIIDITDSTTCIRGETSRVIDLTSRHPDNKGFECLGFDRNSRSLLTMLEKAPYNLLRIPLLPDNSSGPTQTEPLHLQVADVTGISVTPDGDLWILSEESSCLLKVRQGHEILRMPIATDQNLQAEGIAFDDHGNLIIVGEPNLICVYRHKNPSYQANLRRNSR